MVLSWWWIGLTVKVDGRRVTEHVADVCTVCFPHGLPDVDQPVARLTVRPFFNAMNTVQAPKIPGVATHAFFRSIQSLAEAGDTAVLCKANVWENGIHLASWMWI